MGWRSCIIVSRNSLKHQRACMLWEDLSPIGPSQQMAFSAVSNIIWYRTIHAKCHIEFLIPGQFSLTGEFRALTSFGKVYFQAQIFQCSCKSLGKKSVNVEKLFLLHLTDYHPIRHYLICYIYSKIINERIWYQFEETDINLVCLLVAMQRFYMWIFF